MNDLDQQDIDQYYPMPALPTNDEYYAEQLRLRWMAMGLIPKQGDE